MLKLLPGSLRAKQPTKPLLMKLDRNFIFCSGVPNLFINPAYSALWILTIVPVPPQHLYFKTYEGYSTIRKNNRVNKPKNKKMFLRSILIKTINQ